MSENNPFKELKPIDQANQSLDHLVNDMKEIKNDINHIKEYIRKLVIKQQIEEQEALRQENEYVQPSKSWFY